MARMTLISFVSSFSEGVDYTPVLSTLTFVPSPDVSQVICIDVSVVDDSTFEDAETFTISLEVSEEVRSAVSIHIGEATIAIVDDDQVTLSLAAESRNLAESAGTFEVCVMLNGQTEKTIPYELSVAPLEGKQDIISVVNQITSIL